MFGLWLTALSLPRFTSCDSSVSIVVLVNKVGRNGPERPSIEGEIRTKRRGKEERREKWETERGRGNGIAPHHLTHFC